MAGVLNPQADIGGTPQIVQSAVLGNAAIERPGDANFNTSSLTVSAPPAPPSRSATGAGTLPEGVYRYRVVWRDGNGLESSPSSEVSIDTTGLGTAGLTDIELTDIPAAPPGVWQTWELYRTTAGGNTFYRVETSPAEQALSTYTDNTTDADLLTLNETLDTSSVDPGTYSYYVTYFNPSENIETRPTSRVTANSIPDAGRRVHIDLSDIEPPADSGFTSMRIYRNVSGNTSDFRLVDEVPANGRPGFVSTYVDTANDATIATALQLNFDGPPANNGNNLQDLLIRNGDTYTPLFATDGELSFTGERNGVDTATQTLAVDASTTVGQLMTFMREALGITTTGVPDLPVSGNVEIINGQIRVTSNLGEENAIDIPLTAFRFRPEGSTLSSPLSIPFNRTQAADGPGTSTEFLVYDSLGLPLNVRVTTVRETSADPSNSTTYRWYATSSGNQPNGGVSTVIGNGILVFDSEGNLDQQSTPTSRISIARDMTASLSPLEIELDFSRVTSLGQTDGQGNPTSNLNMTVQDGFPPGVLTDFTVTESGLIQGQFSNGVQRTLGQLAMVRFANNGGLRQVGDSLYTTGVNSGEPIYALPGEEGIGTLTTGAVELSNTDIGQNLIELILASTQYRGGARVITAAQELLDELMALRR
jgi:flagellar hook protein FlgE